jgi:hypothetical protein
MNNKLDWCFHNPGVTTKLYVAHWVAVEQCLSSQSLAVILIIADKKNLFHLHVPMALTMFWQRQVFTKMLSMTYSIVCTKKTCNALADANSRRPSLSTENYTCLSDFSARYNTAYSC